MEQNLIDIYDMIEHAIDYAFDGRMNLKFYDYLKTTKIKKHEIDAFIESTTAVELSDLVLELAEIKHVIYKLNRDYTREEFYDKFGKGSTFPRVIKDDTIIGGCTETVKYLREQKLV